MLISEQGYFVLASLQDGPLHGYPMLKRAAELSGGRVVMAAGTLYAVLDRLLSAELISLVSADIVDGRARKTYELTEQGKSALHDEAARLAAAARVVIERSEPAAARVLKPRSAPALNTFVAPA